MKTIIFIEIQACFTYMPRLSEAMKNEVKRIMIVYLVYVDTKIFKLHSGIPNILKKSISLKHLR